jgi:hypothetical protein
VTADLVVRVACLLVCAWIAGVAIGRALRRRGVLRWQLLTLAAFALAGVFGQVTLLDQPVTIRTAASCAASAIGLVWTVLLRIKGPPITVDDGLTAREKP